MLGPIEQMYIDTMRKLASGQKTLFQNNRPRNRSEESSYTRIRERITGCSEKQLTERQVFLKINAVYCYITTGG